MKTSRYTEAQIIAILRRAEGGIPVADRPNIPFMVCRQTIAGQWGIGGITPAQKLKMAA
jgi:hypothetical protein